MTDLLFASAEDVLGRIRRREVSPVEVVEACLAQIARVDPVVHATITVAAEQAVAAARLAEQAVSRGDDLGLLHGLPVGVKDIIPTAGIRTTYGSAAFANHTPPADAVTVRRLREAGALVVAKTNTPEFGMYMNTTSVVGGTTLNPWDLRLNSGGSSGGSAAGLATGMWYLALGTDLGGSARLPCAFTGTVGLRPTPGSVPVTPSEWEFDPFEVQGPMARTVGDVALMLSVLSGHGPALRDPSGSWRDPPCVAWSLDLGGLFDVDHEVGSVVHSAVRGLTDLGFTVSDDHPDLAEIADPRSCILPLRAFRALIIHGQRLDEAEQLDNPLFRRLLVDAQRLDALDVANAERLRSRVWAGARSFFDTYDLLLLPTTQFPGLARTDWFPPDINGVPVLEPMESVLSTYLISMMGWVAMSLPCGFTSAGIPVGLQVVGPAGAEPRVLQAAMAMERHFDVKTHAPTLPLQG